MTDDRGQRAIRTVERAGENGPVAVRASDAEREAMVALLGRHGAEGRLAPEELDERIEAALRARTRAELEALAVDLPPEAGVAGGRPERTARPRSSHGWLGPRRLAAVGGVGVAAAAAGEPALLWLLWPVLAVGKHHQPRRSAASPA